MYGTLPVVPSLWDKITGGRADDPERVTPAIS
jgi:hypothetical protein